MADHGRITKKGNMDGKGTGAALCLMTLWTATALLLFYLVWTRPDLQERDLGGVLGVFLLVMVFVGVAIYQSKFDASGGRGGLGLSFSARYGEITFYDFRKETVFGLQFENGRLTTKTNYTYRYDVKELYGPLQALVTGNGWTYKNVPVFAKWLTG